jgi:hypothetical protein
VKELVPAHGKFAKGLPNPQLTGIAIKAIAKITVLVVRNATSHSSQEVTSPNAMHTSKIAMPPFATTQITNLRIIAVRGLLLKKCIAVNMVTLINAFGKPANKILHQALSSVVNLSAPKTHQHNHAWTQQMSRNARLTLLIAPKQFAEAPLRRTSNSAN